MAWPPPEDVGGLRTALLERGRSAASRDELTDRELSGFDGVSGGGWRSAYEQAWVFGTHLVYGNAATSLAETRTCWWSGWKMAAGRARAVVIASGVSHRRQDPELEALVAWASSTARAPSSAGGSRKRPL